MHKKTTKARLLFLTGALLLLGGCACFTGHDAYPVILTPQEALLGKRIMHTVNINSNDTSETIIIVLEPGTDKTQMAGLTTTGITLFTLEYTKTYQELNTSALYSNSIKPLQLLTALQLVNYSTDTFTQQLPENWNLYTEGKQRYLRHYDKTKLYSTFLDDANLPEATTNATAIVNDMDNNLILTITRLSVEDIR